MRIPPRNWFRNRLASVLLVFGALLVTSAAPAADQAPAQPAQPAQAAQQVRVSTNMGDFVIELMPDRAPLTVANFVRYVKEGYYSGTLIHRVVANFVIQGGGHSATDLKLKAVHDPVNNESGNGLQNKRGTVGLARGESPHSGNAQFYVNLVDNPDLDPLPTRWGYAVFGRVVSGMDIVDKIKQVKTANQGMNQNVPVTPVIIKKATLEQ